MEFGNAALLHHELHPGKEVYAAYFCEGEFVILAESGGVFAEFDAVPVASSPTLVKVAGHYTPLDYQYLDVFLDKL